MALPAFAAARHAAAWMLLSGGQQSISISCSLGPQQQSMASKWDRQTDRQTDGQTYGGKPYHYIVPVLHTMRAVPVMCFGGSFKYSRRARDSWLRADRLYTDTGRQQSPRQLSPASAATARVSSTSPRAKEQHVTRSCNVEQQQRSLTDDERPTCANRPTFYIATMRRYL